MGGGKGRTFGGLGFVGVVGADEMGKVLVYCRAVGAAVVFHPSLECRWRARLAKVAGDGDAEASQDGSRHGGGGPGVGRVEDWKCETRARRELPSSKFDRVQTEQLQVGTVKGASEGGGELCVN